MSSQIKINLDESFLGSSGRGGIVRVFRDSKSKVLLQFGKEVRVDSTVHAEILAFREWILVAKASHWLCPIHSCSNLTLSQLLIRLCILRRFHGGFTTCCVNVVMCLVPILVDRFLI